MRLLGVRPPHEVAAPAGSRNPAIFTSLMGLLQARATGGPLAALAGGKIGGGAFVAKLSNLISTFDRGAAQFLEADRAALDSACRHCRETHLRPPKPSGTSDGSRGCIASGTNATYFYLKDATTTIRQLTLSRPLWPMGTPNLSLYQRADTLAHNLEFDVVNPAREPKPAESGNREGCRPGRSNRIPGRFRRHAHRPSVPAIPG